MISFQYQDVAFRLDLEEDVRKWLCFVAEQQTREIGQLTYVFVTDDQLLYMNEKYLQHDTLTDILTFDYSSNQQSPVVADVFISLERVIDNATTYAQPFVDELHRVMVHGLLHICGYEDKTEEQQQRMRRQEDVALNLRLF